METVRVAGTIPGVAAFVVSLPVTWATREVDHAEKLFVRQPYGYTLKNRRDACNQITGLQRLRRSPCIAHACR